MSHTRLPYSDLETQRNIGGERAFTIKGAGSWGKG